MDTIPPPTAGGGRSFSSQRWCIMLFAPDGTHRFYLEPGVELTIGRSTSAGICVEHPTISREHAVFTNRGAPVLHDLRSRNGTRVDGRQLAPGEECPLTDGSRVEIGPAVLILHLERTSRGRFRVARRHEGIEGLELEAGFGAMIVGDPLMRDMLKQAELAARTQLPILVLGETGVGKEHVAEFVHMRSTRRDRPLVRVNCAALTPSLVEAELFGHERGAFTGADSTKAGLIELADSGSLFLDEIGDLPMTAQAKLLRVLEVGEFMRVGSAKVRKVDVRFIAATHRDLNAVGSFRADLYHRLNGVTLRIPPLRERRADIQALSLHFAERAAMLAGRPVPHFDQAALDRLSALPWPGNVRQLRRFIERWILMLTPEVVTLAEVDRWLARDDVHCLERVPDSIPEASGLEMSGWESVTVTDGRIAGDHPGDHVETPVAFESVPAIPAVPMVPTFPFQVRATPAVPESSPDIDPHRSLEAQLIEAQQRRERERILAALATTGGNQARAAEILGISRRTLINRLDQLGVPRPRKKV